MKLFVNAAIAVSLFAPAASAGQSGSAFGNLLSASGLSAAAVPAAGPAVSVAIPAPGLTAGLSDLNSAQADALASTARSQGFAVFELDGSRMKTKQGLMNYAAQALGLPADMDNWDAMIDYLGDMPTFQHNSNIVILVRNASAIQNADPKLYSDLRDVAELSCRNADEWTRSAATLKFVFIP